MEKGPNPATMCVIGELRSDAYHSFVHRMRLALTALVASGILFSAATFQATRLYRDSTRRLENTRLIFEKTVELCSSVEDAETSQRGYLAGQPSLFNPFLAAKARISGRLQDLRALVSNTPRQRQNVDRLAAAMSEKLAELSETVGLTRDWRLETSLATALRGYSAEMRAEAERLMSDIRRAQSRNETVLWLAAGAATLTVFLLTAVILLFLKTYRMHRQAVNNRQLVEQEVLQN